MSRLIGLLIAVLPGCMSAAVLASPPAWQEIDAASVKLTLEEAVRLTLDRAPEALLAKAAALRSRETVRETRSLNQPQVALGTGLAYNNGFPLSLEGAAPSLFQFGLSQSILSKKNRRLILEAEENSRASQLDIEVVRNELASTAALAYGQLHMARKAETIWSSRLQSFIQTQELVELQLQAGRARPLDVVLAKAVTSRVRQQLLVAREQALMAAVQLKDLTGLPETSRVITTDSRLAEQVQNIPPDKLFQRALEASPEIRQAEALLQARQHHLEAEKGENYPRVDVVGQYALFSKVNNYQDYFNRFSRNNFLVGLSIQVPVFNGHRTSARVAQSQQEVAEARFRLQRLKSELKLSLERAGSALRIARGASELAAQELGAAREGLQVQEAMLEAGRAETKDVEAARDLVSEKELAAVDAAKAVFQQQLELLRLSGVLTTLFKAD